MYGKIKAFLAQRGGKINSNAANAEELHPSFEDPLSCVDSKVGCMLYSEVSNFSSHPVNSMRISPGETHTPEPSRSLALTSSPSFFWTGITVPGPIKERGTSSMDLPPRTMWLGASMWVPTWQVRDISVTFRGCPLSRLKNF